MKTLILLLMVSFGNKPMTITLPHFEGDEHIPTKYTCAGQNVSPEIKLNDIPEGTKSLAVIVYDPDADGGNFDHWLIWNIPVTEDIAENTAPGTQGRNSEHKNTYTGPCPSSGIHNYHFKVFALDIKLKLAKGSSKKALIKAMNGHVLEQAELVALFSK